MPEIVIRGGTVLDGTGAPGHVADVSISDGRDRGDRHRPPRRPRARRHRLRGRAGLHRHPHPLRRAGLLGPRAPAVVVPGRHHRRGRQLRLRHRAHPARAPRHDRGHARERRGHGSRDADRGHRLGVRDVSASTWSRSAVAGRCSTSPRTSGTPRCGSTSWATRPTSGPRRPDEVDAHVRSSCGRRSTRVRPGSRPASRTRTAASTASRSRAASPTATRCTRLFPAAGEAGKGVVLITPGEQCTYADVYEWQPRIGRPFTYPMFASPGGKHLEPLALHEQGIAAGASVWPQVTPRPLTMQFTLGRPLQPQHRHGVR